MKIKVDTPIYLVFGVSTGVMGLEPKLESVEFSYSAAEKAINRGMFCGQQFAFLPDDIQQNLLKEKFITKSDIPYIDEGGIYLIVED